MSEIFIDYRAARLTGPAVAASSYQGQPITGAVRYVDDPRFTKTKHTTPTEYKSLVGAGLKVRLVFEVSTNDSSGGYAAGVAYAQRALAGANQLGYTGVIYFCNDQTTLVSVSAWRSYLDGAASVLGLGRVGAYGFRNAIDAAQGHASAYWQCGAKSALHPDANMYQFNNGTTSVGGITCDVNYVYSDYFGPEAPPTPTDSTEDLSMRVEAGTNVITAIPCDGKQKLFIQAGFGHVVEGHMWFIADTNSGSGKQYLGDGPVHIDSDRPGPVTVPPWTRVVSLQTTCDIPFTAWCA